MAEINKEQIRQICRSVELAIGQPVQTPKDFDILSQTPYYSSNRWIPKLGFQLCYVQTLANAKFATPGQDDR